MAKKPIPSGDINVSGQNVSGLNFVQGDNANITTNVNTVIQMGWREIDPERAKAFGVNPYRGMTAFQEEDADRFFGRDELVDGLWKRFLELTKRPLAAGAYRLLPILGPSGSGKSSVARAGLIGKRLRKTPPPGVAGYRIATFTPATRPLHWLARALAEAETPELTPVARVREFEDQLRQAIDPANPDAARRAAVALGDIADTIGKGCDVVLLVDQFEEVFSLCPSLDERRAFIQMLLDATADPDGSLSVILTMRTDFFGQTQAHNALNQVLAKTGVLIPTMSHTEIEATILEPARTADPPHPIDDAATVNALVAETLDRDGALPLLQFMLEKIWNGMAHGVQPGDTFRELGGLGGVVATAANAIYADLSQAEQDIARRAFLAMVTFNANQQPTRRRASLSEMAAPGEETDAIRSVLERFAQQTARLVVLSAGASGADSELRAEVAHEALFSHWDKLKAWLEEGRDDIRFHQRVAEAAEAWRDQHRPAGSLWRPPNLDLLQAYAERAGPSLNQLETEFLEASQAAIEEEVRQARIQKSNLLAGAAFQAVLDDDAPLGVLLGLEALPGEDAGSSDFRRAEAALLAAVLNQNELWRVQAGGLEALQISVDGARLLIASRRLAELFETATGRLLRRFELKGYGASVLADPTGRRVLQRLSSGAPKLWNVDSGDALSLTDGENSDAQAFSPDGRRIVAVGWDFSLSPEKTAPPAPEDEPAVEPSTESAPAAEWRPNTWVLDADTGARLTQLSAPTGRVSRVVWSPDGARIVTDGDEELRVWDASTGELLATLVDPRAYSEKRSATYSPDGALLAICEGDGVTLLDGATLQPKGRLDVYGAAVGDGEAGRVPGYRSSVAGDALTGFVFSPDGDRMLTWTAEGGAQIWAGVAAVVRDGGPDPALVAKLNEKTRTHIAAFSADGKQVLIASDDRAVGVWEASTGRRLGELRGHQSEVTHLVCASGAFAVTGSDDDTVRMWKNPELDYDAMLAGAEGRPLSSIGFSPDGARILGMNYRGDRSSWNAGSFELLDVAAPAAAELGSAEALSPDGSLVAWSKDHGVDVRDAKTGELVIRRTGLDEFAGIGSAVFSPDGQGFFFTTRGHAELMNLPSGKRRFAIRGDENDRGEVAFSRDGRRLMLSRSITWKGGNARLPGRSDWRSCGAFSPDGRYVAAGLGPTVEVWDSEGENRLVVLRGHERAVTAIAYSPDGRIIATAAMDLTIRLWDADLGQGLGVVGRLTDEVKTLSFSPAGDALLAAAPIGPAYLWRVSIPSGRRLRDVAVARRIRDFTPQERQRYGLEAPASETPAPVDTAS
jgi:WD40 repeat protein